MKVGKLFVMSCFIFMVGFSFLISGCTCSNCRADHIWPLQKDETPMKETAKSTMDVQEQRMIYPVINKSGQSVSLVKTLPKQVASDEIFDYRIDVTNLTDSTVYNVRVKDTVSANLTFIDSTPQIDSIEDNEVCWVIPSLKPAGTVSINTKAVAAGTGYIQSSAMVDYDCFVCSNIKIIEAELKLVKSAPAEVSTCERILVSYDITNYSTKEMLDIVITEELPEGLLTAEGKKVVEFELKSLPGGQSRQFTQIIDAIEPGTYSSEATLFSSTGASVKSNMTETKITQAVLSLKEIYPEEYTAGSDTVLEFVISNIGDGIARDTQIVAMLPSGVEFAGASSNGSLGGVKQSEVAWKLGELEPNMSKKVSLTYKSDRSEIVKTLAVAKAHCANSVTAFSDKMLSDLSEIVLYKPFAFE